jgi:uncharacterized protein YjbI with pentapeptide repeats
MELAKQVVKGFNMCSKNGINTMKTAILLSMLALITHAGADPKVVNGCRIEPSVECTGANLATADLALADLRFADLRGTDLQGAILTGAKLQGAFLQKAQLARSNLRGANLRWARLRGANLQGSDLEGADLSSAIWIDGRECAQGSIGKCK